MPNQTTEVIGITCLVFCNIMLIMSFAPPYWLVFSGDYGKPVRLGLWSRCTDKGDCLWSMNFRYGYQKSLPAWFHATQGLMAAGLALGLVALMVAASALCCECCRNCHPARQVALCLLGCCLCVGIAVIVFGAKAADRYGATIDPAFDSIYTKFGWSFWLGAASAVMALLTSCIYFCANSGE